MWLIPSIKLSFLSVSQNSHDVLYSNIRFKYAVDPYCLFYILYDGLHTAIDFIGTSFMLYKDDTILPKVDTLSLVKDFFLFRHFYTVEYIKSCMLYIVSKDLYDFQLL